MASTLFDIMSSRYGHPTEERRNGETHWPCPQCGEGEDRFIIWPDHTSGYCRLCYWQGDAIQYLRDFEGKSYPAAAEAVGKTLTPRERLPKAIASTMAKLELEYHQWHTVMLCAAIDAYICARDEFHICEIAYRTHHRQALSEDLKSYWAIQYATWEHQHYLAARTLFVFTDKRQESTRQKLWKELMYERENHI